MSSDSETDERHENVNPEKTSNGYSKSHSYQRSRSITSAESDSDETDVDKPSVASVVRVVNRKSPKREVRSNSPSPPQNRNRRERSPFYGRRRSPDRDYHRRRRSPETRESSYRSRERRRSPSYDRSTRQRRSKSPRNRRERSRSPLYRRKRSESPVVDKFAHFRRRRSRSISDDDDRKDVFNVSIAENQHWEKVRSKRDKICEEGVPFIWARSPTKSDLHAIYEEHESVQKSLKSERRKMEKEEQKRQKAREKAEAKAKRREQLGIKVTSSTEDSSSETDSSEEERKKRKKKKKSSKKDKKSKKRSKKNKKKKRKHSSDDSDADSGDEIHSKKNKKKSKREKTESASENDVEMAEHVETQLNAADEDAQMIGPAVPEHLLINEDPSKDNVDWDVTYDATVNKDMLRGEAAAMAAYVAQGKRIPRRGEIGLSSDEITSFEKVGYVMSGTRHKAMEATRLRKENQIMTADEKRMLSGFSQEQRKQKEDLILQRMRHLVDSKKNN